MGVILIVHFFLGLRAFSGIGSDANATIPIGQTVYIGIETVPTKKRAARSLDLDSVSPNVAYNRAAADLKILVCTIKTHPVGVAHSLASLCSTVTALHGGRLSLGNDRGQQQIVVAVTPRKAGSVHIVDLYVRFNNGFRLGSQHIKIDSTITGS